MMKILLLVALLTTVTLAQQTNPTPIGRIVWQDMGKCAYVYLEEKTAECDRFLQNGEAVRTITYGDISLGVVIAYDRSYQIADVIITNKSQNRIDIDPSKSRIVYYREGFSKPGETVESIPGTTIAKKIRSRVAWANALGAMGAAMQTTTTTSQSQTNGTASVYGTGGSATGTYSGNTTTTTTGPDKQAQANEAIRGQQRAAAARGAGAAYINNGLLANTVFPGNSVAGQIYFKRVKVEDAVFSIEINGISMDFVFSSKPPKK